MMPCFPSPGGHAAPLLISLAFGYGVLILARRETRPLNILGKVIGWLIIAVSAIGLLCTAACGLWMMCPRHRMECGGEAAMGCPFSGRHSVCIAPQRAADDDNENEGDEKSAPSPAPNEKK